MNAVASAAPSAVESAMATFAQLAQAGAEPGDNNMDSQMYGQVTEKLKWVKNYILKNSPFLP